jgi:hypothetical protein
MKMKSFAMGVLIAAAFAATSEFATAATFTSGFGQADVTLSAGSISITLRDLAINPTDVLNNVSGFQITFASPTLGATSSYVSAGQERTVTSNSVGGYTVGPTVPTGWLLSSTANSVTLQDLLGGAGPAHTIIGAPDGSNAYSAANSSITVPPNAPHNPFLFGDVTFSFNVANVTANSQIASVDFQFGTVPGFGVPEPASISLLGMGIVSMAGYGWRRRKSVKA